MTVTSMIPRKAAARILARQEVVTRARRSVVFGDLRIQVNGDRVASYERDPVAFADEWYPGEAADSYPVVTNVARCRERIEHDRLRAPGRLSELLKAEDTLRQTEVEVIAQVSSMRPSSGRVPWPDPLPSFDELRDMLEALHATEIEEDRRLWKERQAGIDESQRREMVDFDRERADERAAFRAHMGETRRAMTPAQRASHDAFVGEIGDAVVEGSVAVRDAPALAREIVGRIHRSP